MYILTFHLQIKCLFGLEMVRIQLVLMIYKSPNSSKHRVNQIIRGQLTQKV